MDGPAGPGMADGRPPARRGLGPGAGARGRGRCRAAAHPPGVARACADRCRGRTSAAACAVAGVAPSAGSWAGRGGRNPGPPAGVGGPGGGPSVGTGWVPGPVDHGWRGAPAGGMRKAAADSRRSHLGPAGARRQAVESRRRPKNHDSVDLACQWGSGAAEPLGLTGGPRAAQSEHLRVAGGPAAGRAAYRARLAVGSLAGGQT